jgi:flagellar biosynthesis component FlhA
MKNKYILPSIITMAIGVIGFLLLFKKSEKKEVETPKEEKKKTNEDLKEKIETEEKTEENETKETKTEETPKSKEGVKEIYENEFMSFEYKKYNKLEERDEETRKTIIMSNEKHAPITLTIIDEEKTNIDEYLKTNFEIFNENIKILSKSKILTSENYIGKT